MLLPTLAGVVGDPRYSPADKRAAADYCIRKLDEQLRRALAAGDEQRAANYRRALDVAARIAAEWSD